MSEVVTPDAKAEKPILLFYSKDQHILALDCKMSFDFSKQFELRDKSQEDPKEIYALDGEGISKTATIDRISSAIPNW